MYRDPDILKLAQGQPCLINCHPYCLGDEGSTTVSAHSNQLIHGKGRGLKADDCMSVWACHRCHAHLDSGDFLSKEKKQNCSTGRGISKYKNGIRLQEILQSSLGEKKPQNESSSTSEPPNDPRRIHPYPVTRSHQHAHPALADQELLRAHGAGHFLRRTTRTGRQCCRKHTGLDGRDHAVP